MADFSKEYIDIMDPGGLAWDFSIQEVAKDLHPGNYIAMICEGIGFTAIGKDQEGGTILYFPDYDEEDKSHWRDYKEVMEDLINESNNRSWK